MWNTEQYLATFFLAPKLKQPVLPLLTVIQPLHASIIFSANNMFINQMDSLNLSGICKPYIYIYSLPRWLSGKASTCQCWRHRRHGFDPWVGKILWRRKWQPTPVFLPGESHGWRSLVDYSPKGRKESDTTEQQSARVRVHTHTHTHPENCIFSNILSHSEGCLFILCVFPLLCKSF